MTRVFDPISAVDGRDSEMLRRGRRRAVRVNVDRQRLCSGPGVRDKVLERVVKVVVRGHNAKAICEFVKGLDPSSFSKRKEWTVSRSLCDDWVTFELCTVVELEASGCNAFRLNTQCELAQAL